MRGSALLIASLLLLLAPAGAAGTLGPSFGQGPVAFEEVIPDHVTRAPEPTMGIPWNTDDVFYHAGSTTVRGTFHDDGTVTWVDVTPPYQVPINLDPLLVADEDSGRILAGGLHGACSVMMISDDNGETWIPSGNMCSGGQFDHQSIGIGPKPGGDSSVPNLQNAYYCGQLGLIGCSVSYDGGESWTSPTPFVGDCGGFHGHWRISRVTGAAFLPVADCGDESGMLVSVPEAGLVNAPTALLFEARTVDGSTGFDGGFDPSIGITRDSGWLYYGYADKTGARIGLSKDEGLSWETLGTGTEATPTTWLDVGQFHDPPVTNATFADVQAGDDERVVYTFLGLEDLDGDGKGDEYHSPYACDMPKGREENRVWHYYAAFSYDAGATWNVTRLTDHPVQIGGIWNAGGDAECRNLLDFNDMDIDSTGRAYIAWADGCLDDCTDKGKTRYNQAPRILRQVGGQGVFAAYDTEADVVAEAAPESSSNQLPVSGALPVLALLGAAAIVARKRQD